MNNNQLTLAIVEDEDNLRESLIFALKKEGYNIIAFNNGQDALTSFKSKIPDFILSDILMPIMDGIELCKNVRIISNNVPFMYLTSKDDEFDKILGLEIGADDYLCKPFSLRELVTRIKVILRRYKLPDLDKQSNKYLNNGGLNLNIDSYTANLNGKEINFTVTEFRLLEELMSNLDIVKSREQLISVAYPHDSYISDRNVDCHIKRLRKKISQVDNNFTGIQSVYGVGYKMVKI